MRIAVAAGQTLFVRGGAELLAEALVRELRSRGHDADSVRVPLTVRSSGQLLDSLAAARLLRLPGYDRVIALKCPAYLIPHDDKVVWLLHQLRQAYELRGTPLGLPTGPEYDAAASAVHGADAAGLAEARRLYAISDVVRSRLRRFCDLDAHLLRPPLPRESRIPASAPGDYVVFPGRIADIKRQWLAIEAMAHVSSSVRLVVAGPPDGPEALERLRRLVQAHGLASSVSIVPEWISDETRAELLGGALACLYVPQDEDYGFVCLEAYEAGRAVVTCDDAGGPLELVVDDVTGLVVPADAEAIAAALDRLHADRSLARRLGEAGRAHAGELGISWDRVVEELTS